MTLSKGQPATYEMIRELSRGGMAVVYLARRYGPAGVEQLVAVKRPDDDAASDDEKRAAFADEARLLASLSHPNVVSVVALEETGAVPWLVMEHVDGVTLDDLLVRARTAGTGRLPRTEALSIALSLAEALVYLHAHLDELAQPLRIVHRDVTPRNVMVTFDGAVKLIDFGIASASSHEVQTRTGVIKGTPGFMAPEQLRGEALDHRADLFSFGVTLYALVVGTLPWPTPDARLLDADAAAIPPSRRIEGVPAELDALVMRCLAPSPEDRPGTMAEIRDALAAILSREGHVPTMGAVGAMVRALVPRGERPDPATVVRIEAPRGLPPWVRRYLLPLVALAAVGALAFAAGRLVASL